MRKAVVLVTTIAVLLLLPAIHSGSTGAAIVPPQDPGSNIYPAPGYSGPCGSLAAPNPYCPSGLTKMYGDRQVEGIGPMSLPTNYASLTPPEQLFVLTDLERIDRGIAPISGLSANLDAYAQAGANAGHDPGFPPYAGAGGSTWSSSGSLGLSLAEWMYNDGPGGSNADCPATGGGGCWRHRDIILGQYASPSMMGVGYGSGTTQIFVGGDTVDTPYFTWAQEIPLLPVGVFASGINDSVLPGQSHTSTIQLWASGAYMDIMASITGGGSAFSASTASCNLPAGGSCDMALTFTPPSLGAFTTTLVVTGPNGTQYVPLRAVSSHGYHLAAADGGVFSFGDALFYGSMGGHGLNSPIVGMAATPDGGGYWEVAADGGVFSFGDALFYGSRGGLPVDGSIVGMAADATGHGYWLVSSQGGIFSFGDATFFGSAGNLPLNRPVLGMAATADGGGYWLVASDGGIFTYGDAPYLGSTGGYPLVAPVVGMASTTEGAGYWLIASDGGVFNFGDAGFFGSMGGKALVQPVVGGSAQN